jgi:hypothetical protein
MNIIQANCIAASEQLEISKNKSIQACRTRVILSEQQAIKIYEVKLANDAPSLPGSKNIRAAQLAVEYGVSDKTIRDIWRGRTWYLFRNEPTSIVVCIYTI